MVGDNFYISFGSPWLDLLLVFVFVVWFSYEWLRCFDD